METVRQILHIDRSPLMLAGMQTLIERTSKLLTLHQSTESSSLIKLFEQYLPDLIILDIKDFSADIYKKFQQMTSDQNVNIMVLTYSTLQSDIIQCIQSGVKGYLLKSCSNSFISSSIEQVLLGKKCLSPEVNQLLSEKKELDHLTVREVEILQSVTKGKSNKSIASEMSISEWTVKSHMKSILSKLNASSRTDAAFKAVEQGIVSYHQP